jgi:hypothetical protein
MRSEAIAFAAHSETSVLVRKQFNRLEYGCLGDTEEHGGQKSDS